MKALNGNGVNPAIIIITTPCARKRFLTLIKTSSDIILLNNAISYKYSPNIYPTRPPITEDTVV